MWECSHLSNAWVVGVGLAIVLPAAVLIGLFLRRGRGDAARRVPRRDRADSMEILRIRYARGEIDEEAFFRMREALRPSNREK